MTTTDDSEILPVWARPEAFPRADDGWGWVDRKGRRTPCANFEELAASIIDDAGARVDMVWTPDYSHLVLPEEVPELLPALKTARLRWAEWEIAEGRRQMLIFGGFMAVFVVYARLTGGEIMAFGPLGLALLLFLILGFIPWYQGKKRHTRARRWQAGEVGPDLDEMRFETWLSMQRAPVTRGLLALITLVGLVQWLGPRDVMGTVEAAGLTKTNGRAEDWWRLATAPFLHGHPIHYLFNAAALAYLGKRVELLVRWPHVALVFVLSAWVGGECSARWIETPSLGASGGLLGLLGFLLVFESSHRELVPVSSRRRLLAGFAMTAAIGAIGYMFIDNAAHGGGVVAGMVYALVLFPKSGSPRRPPSGRADEIAGALALAACAAAAAWAVWMILG